MPVFIQKRGFSRKKMKMLAQVNGLGLCRGGKLREMSYVATIRCRVFAIFNPTTEGMATPQEIRHLQTKRSLTETQ